MKIKYSILFFAVLFITSCSIYQRGERVDRKQNKLKRMSSEKLYNEVVAHYLEYENVNFKKLTITYEEGKKKQEFRGSMRVLKDSVIWLSISKMGIEGVRVLLTPSRVSLIDRMHREYMTTDYSFLSQKFHLDLDFFLIQSIIMNQLPEYRLVEDDPFYKNFKSRRSKDKKHYFFINRHRKERKYWKERAKKTGNTGFTDIRLTISPDLMRLGEVFIFEPQVFDGVSSQEVTLNLDYQNYREYEEKYLFPQRISAKLKRKFSHNILNVTEKSEKQIVKLTIEIDKLKVNEPELRFPFKISSKYKRIDE